MLCEGWPGCKLRRKLKGLNRDFEEVEVGEKAGRVQDKEELEKA